LRIAWTARTRTRNDLEAIAEEAPRLLAPEVNELGLGEGDLQTGTLVDLGVAEVWTGRLDAAQQHFERAVDDARQIGRPRLELVALAHWSLAGVLRSEMITEDQARHAIELAQKHGWDDDVAVAAAYIATGGAALYRGRLPEAERWLERAESALRREAYPAPALALYALRGVIELARGRPDRAMVHYREVERRQEPLVTPHLLELRTQVSRLRTFILLGQTDQVERAVAEMDEDVRGTPEARIVLAELRLAQGLAGGRDGRGCANRRWFHTTNHSYL
jgi:LuxR family transcriptional regulator, maltose regulon positive regulatory protein